MNDAEKRKNYRDLLLIRKAARKRDSWITGAICLLSIVGTVGIGLVTGLGSREAYLLAGSNLVFVIAFLMAWVRLEVISNTIELLNHI